MAHELLGINIIEEFSNQANMSTCFSTGLIDKDNMNSDSANKAHNKVNPVTDRLCLGFVHQLKISMAPSSCETNSKPSHSEKTLCFILYSCMPHYQCHSTCETSRANYFSMTSLQRFFKWCCLYLDSFRVTEVSKIKKCLFCIFSCFLWPSLACCHTQLRVNLNMIEFWN